MKERGSGDFSIGSCVWPGLSKLSEEAGEVLQVIGKIIGSRGNPDHWDGSNLRVRLQEELGDILAAIDFVIMHCHLDREAIAERRERKRVLFEKWHTEDVP